MVQTRASNTNKHLGVIDLPKSKRSLEQVAADKEVKAAQQAAAEKAKLQEKKDIAVVEDEITDKNDKDDNEEVSCPKKQHSARNASKNTKKTVHTDEQEEVEEMARPRQRGRKPATKKAGKTVNKNEQSNSEEEAVPKQHGRKPAAKNSGRKTSTAAKKSAATAEGKGGVQGKAKGSKGKGRAKAKTLPVQEDSEEEEEEESTGSGYESSNVKVEKDSESADEEIKGRKPGKEKGKKSRVEKVFIRDEIEALRKPKGRAIYIDSDSDNDASLALHDDQQGKRTERSTAITIQGSVASSLAAPTASKFNPAEAAPARSQKTSSHEVSDKNSETVPPAGCLVSKISLWNNDEYPDPPPLVRQRGKTGVASVVDKNAGTSPTGDYSGRVSKVAKTMTNDKGQNKKHLSDDIVSDAAMESGPTKKLKPSADVEGTSTETAPNALASRKCGLIETDSDDNEERVQQGEFKRPRSDAPASSHTINLVGDPQPDHSESNDEALIDEGAHNSSTAAPYKVLIAPKSDDELTCIFDDDDEAVEWLAVLNSPEEVTGARVTSSTMVSVHRKKMTMLTGLNIVSQSAVKPTAPAATAPAALAAKSAASATKSTAPIAKPTAYTAKFTVFIATSDDSKGREDEDAESSMAVDDQQVTTFGNVHQTDGEVCDKDHATAGGHHSDNATEANTSLERPTSGRCCKRASGQGSDPDGQSNEKPNSKSTKITMQMLPDQLQKKSAWKWFAGSLKHWGATKTNPFSLNDYDFCDGAQSIWAAMYSNRGPSITLRCPLAKQRFGTYKNAMALSALVELNTYFDRYKGYKEHYERFASMTEQANYVDKCIKTASFIYKEYEVADGTKRVKGAFRNPILMRVLSNHYNRVNGWIYESPFIDLKERPMGALALAVAALEHALTLYVSKRVLFVNGKNGDLTHAANIDLRKVPQHGDVKTRPTTLKAVRGTTGIMTTHDLDFSGDNYAEATEGWAREVKALFFRQLDAIFEYTMHIHKGFDDPPVAQKLIVPKMQNIVVSEDEDGDRDRDGHWYGY